MVLEVAGGVAARADVDGVVVHALDAFAVEVTAALLGPHLGDDAFLRLEVVLHLHGLKGRFPLGEDGTALYLSQRVGHATRRAGAGLEVEFQIVGLQDDVVVFGLGIAVIEDLLLVHVAI